MRARVARQSHSGCDKYHKNRDCIQPAHSDGVRALTKGSGFGPARDVRREKSLQRKMRIRTYSAELFREGQFPDFIVKVANQI
jgi:hypothetical protein